VLDAVVELLQSHELCFRSQGLLIFPTAVQLERVQPLSDLENPVAVHLEVSGPLKNVYAAIVVHLRRTRSFGEDVRLWRGLSKAMAGCARSIWKRAPGGVAIWNFALTINVVNRGKRILLTRFSTWPG